MPASLPQPAKMPAHDSASPSLAPLSEELLDIIIKYAYQDEDFPDNNTLYQLSLASKQFNRIVKGHLYTTPCPTRPRFDEKNYMYRSVELILRTCTEQPLLAEEVKSLSIVTVGQVFRPEIRSSRMNMIYLTNITPDFMDTTSKPDISNYHEAGVLLCSLPKLERLCFSARQVLSLRIRDNVCPLQVQNHLDMRH
jgi:hypothetical protein